MIEVIKSNFARVELETSASEAVKATESAKFKTDSDVDKAAKTTDIEHKKAKETQPEQTLEDRKDDLEGT